MTPANAVGGLPCNLPARPAHLGRQQAHVQAHVHLLLASAKPSRRHCAAGHVRARQGQPQEHLKNQITE